MSITNTQLFALFNRMTKGIEIKTFECLHVVFKLLKYINDNTPYNMYNGLSQRHIQ